LFPALFFIHFLVEINGADLMTILV